MKRDKITHERRHIRQRLEILDRLLNSDKLTYKELRSSLNRQLESVGDIPISERTLKYDIAFLESSEDAPIHRPAKGDRRIYYTKQFSFRSGIIDADAIDVLKAAVTILRKATNIRLTKEVDGIIARLENKIQTNVLNNNILIAFEEHTEAKGMEHFDEIFSAIREKSTIKLTYQPFGQGERMWIVHPYMLKEYRNRWFLIGRVNSNNYLNNIRLDSIKGKIRNSSEEFIQNNLFNPETYFNDVIGVTIPRDQTPLEIELKVSVASANYVRTKPLHKSQIIKKEYKDGSMVINLKVFNNYELKSTLLSYGSGIKVKKPAELRAEMKRLLKDTLGLYKKGNEK